MISSPDTAASRSLLADWLEVETLFSQHGAGQADIAKLVRLTSDTHRDREADDDGVIVEEEIADPELEEISDRISAEIDVRERALADDYPFHVFARPFRLELKAKLSALNSAQIVYLFLLLMSAQRDKRFPTSDKLEKLVRSGRTLFHACASIGVAGLLRSPNTVWFGWPRDDKTAFLTALAKLCDRMGSGQAKTNFPGGYPQSPKDDDIDVIGWRTYRAPRNGNLLVLCQAATGALWKDKSVLTKVEAFAAWFDIAPYSKATGAMAIPFPAHHEVDEHPQDGFESAVHTAAHLDQMQLGVIIDRLRIVEVVEEIAKENASTNAVDGLDKLPELKAWVENAIDAIAKAA